MNYCKKEVRKWVLGLFEETGMLGLHEAADYKQTDSVSPYLGEIEDVHLHNSRKVAITEVFSKCVGVRQ